MMKKIDNNEIDNNENASIGIGAMIVFIALILVAAVASAVIIQTAEKLQQNAQATGDDTQSEIAGKVQIHDVYLTDGANNYLMYIVVFSLAPGSGSIVDTSINWQAFCLDSADAFDQDQGTFDEDVILEMDGTALNGAGAADILAAGVKYRLAVGSTVVLAGCEPGNVHDGSANGGNDGAISFYVHVEGGGTTYASFDTSGTMADGASIL